MIAHLLESLAACRTLDAVVVATSADPSDDPLAEFCARTGVRCHRGPLDDVAARLLAVAKAEGATALVRLSGDSPLLDPGLVDQAVTLFRSGAADLVSNTSPRSFPKGQSIEVVATSALERAVAGMTTSHEREHVTPHIYAHPDAFSICSFAAGTPRPEVQLSVDTAEDFARCDAIITRLGQPPWAAGWEACVRAADALGVEARS
jgi:spore coat polysaccharide biosynthesis protein SpsF